MSTKPPGLRSRTVSRAAMALPFVLFAVLSTAMVTWFGQHYPTFSPVDEASHYDYLLAVPHVPALGEPLSQETLREVACRGTADLVFEFPPCDAEEFDPLAFPGSGYSATGANSPGYYLVTAAIARPLATATGWPVLDTARGVGALWLAALMSVCYLLCVRLGAGRLAALGATVLVCSAAGVVTSAGTLGADVAAAAAGGLVLLAGLAYDGTRRRLLLLLGAVVLAALVKVTAFTAVGAVAVMLVVRALPRRAASDPADDPADDPARLSTLSTGRALAAGALASIVFVVVSLAWGLRYTWTALIEPEEAPTNAMFQADSIPWAETWEWLAYAFLQSVTQNYAPLILADNTNNMTNLVIGGVLFYAVVAAALTPRSEGDVGPLGLGLLLLALVGPVLLTLMNFYVNGQSFTIPPRYGYALAPGLVAAAAWTLRAPGAARALAVLAVWTVVSVFT